MTHSSYPSAFVSRLSVFFYLSFFFRAFVLVVHFLPSFLPYLLTYLLTHFHSPCSRVLFEKLIGFQLVKKFPAFYGTQTFITAFTSARYLSLS